MAKTTIKSVNGYIAEQPKPAQRVLKRVRSTIQKALRGAEEVISYGIPAYKLNGRVVIYFAGWREHYSIYPITKRLTAAFKEELAPYELSHKGTVRFPLSEPVPVQLIADIAKFRAKEGPARPKAKASARSRR